MPSQTEQEPPAPQAIRMAAASSNEAAPAGAEEVTHKGLLWLITMSGGGGQQLMHVPTREVVPLPPGEHGLYFASEFALLS